MTEHDATEPREVSLRQYTFLAKPTMSAKDFGVLTRFSGGGEVDGDYFELLSGIVRNTLMPEYRKKWDDIWNEDLLQPVTFEELSELANSLAEYAAGRPTQRPSPSGAEAKTSPTSSTADSDSQGERDSLASPSARG